ncbi:MAG: hypothetical protein M1166_08885 [Candidatus Thermoplasmatota archaeon]|jgi:hypothetical protein|nr:hypothetical protein [Candidatus Thermoplasmatota archaeon]
MDMIDRLDRKTPTRQDPVRIISFVTLAMILVITVYSSIATDYNTTIPYSIIDQAILLFLASLLVIIPVSLVYGKHINPAFSVIILVVSFILIYIFFDVTGFFFFPFLFNVALSFVR